MTKEEIEKLLEQEPCTCDTSAVAMGPHYHLSGNRSTSRKKLQSMLRQVQGPAFGQLKLAMNGPFTAEIADGFVEIFDADGKQVSFMSERSFHEIRAAASASLKK